MSPNLLRLHIASMYMSAQKEAWVLKSAYPELFEQIYRPPSNK